MGFGDVTLVAMMGTLMGWQGALILFVLAPLAAIVFGLLQLILRRDQEIPYGPFLCIAALIVLLRWADVWDWVRPYFVGWLVPAMVVASVLLMGAMLKAYSAVKSAAGWSWEP
jgi:hypothetical protein